MEFIIKDEDEMIQNVKDILSLIEYWLGDEFSEMPFEDKKLPYWEKRQKIVQLKAIGILKYKGIVMDPFETWEEKDNKWGFKVTKLTEAEKLGRPCNQCGGTGRLAL